MKKWKYSAWGLFGLIAVTLFVFMQREYAYHFYFVEQNYMFQYSWPYIVEKLLLPGGLADIAGEFLVQYFMYPYAGASITVGLLALIASVTALLLGRIRQNDSWAVLSWIPASCLLFMQFDFNYMLAGFVAYLFMLFFLLGAVTIRNDRWRLVYHVLTLFPMYWIGGSVYVLYVASVLLYELLKKTPYRYTVTLILIGLGALIGYLSIYFALQGEYRFAFLPDMFYHNKLIPKPPIYFSWVAHFLLFGLALLLKPRKVKKTVRCVFELVFSLVVVFLFTAWGIRQYGDQKSQQLKKLDYYARMEQWDEVINHSKGTLTNYLYICYLNRALAEKGQLAESMFLFDQRGVDGLLLKWNRTFSISTLLSDVNFTIGNMTVAQEMAFEANVSATGGGNPRMLKRLIQTNLIYGEYKVAEKYIDLLEKTTYYRKWAELQRLFLYNDEAVEKDSLLGSKRKCLLSENYLSTTFGLDHDLLKIAKQYPANRNALEYLGGLLLLAKDMQAFKLFLDTYYGTELLPELPLGFQEAVIILHESAPAEWEKYGIRESVAERFVHYKKAILANKNSPSLQQRMAHDYGNTYWFYFMFK
ncbi:MAG: DUF6057 family protein [Massilibacteroides sp.]|nr:DUF6057 family protein [Massilibacteroides sp.]MDD4114607.1 DUF6057 family protein [Massilibacteroides sp.]MDD4660506.1 DUF6057 family protein [Massilibacteroides sp.]